ncbi:MAG: hypothetical protein V2A74_13400, partial [bacterium]
NYEMPLVEEYRSHKGPVGAIYVHYPVDFYCNAYIPALYYHNFPSSRARSEAERWGGKIPSGWTERPPVLMDAKGEWMISAQERDELFKQPVYFVVLFPLENWSVRQYLKETAWPSLNSKMNLKRVASRGDVVLFQGTLKKSVENEPSS